MSMMSDFMLFLLFWLTEWPASFSGMPERFMALHGLIGGSSMKLTVLRSLALSDVSLFKSSLFI